jgi:selT/selW/selH-like putative selenoprotein
VGAAEDLLSGYQHVIESLRITPGGKGIFDVTVDGELLFSKKASGRHAEPGEVVARFEARYAKGVSRYGS